MPGITHPATNCCALVFSAAVLCKPHILHDIISLSVYMHTSSFCCKQVLEISYVKMHILLYRLPSKTADCIFFASYSQDCQNHNSPPQQYCTHPLCWVYVVGAGPKSLATIKRILVDHWESNLAAYTTGDLAINYTITNKNFCSWDIQGNGGQCGK
jgi:hypothetical protein